MQEKNSQRYEEDEIDLRELFKTLILNKGKILLLTSFITLAAATYAFLVPKTFEATAIVKLGEYKLADTNTNTNTNTNVVVDNAAELTKELEVLFINLLKNEKEREAWIEKVVLVKNQKNLFELSAQGHSNELATLEIKKVIEYVQLKHKKVLDDLKEFRESQIYQAEGQLVLLKTKTLPSLKEKIARYKKDIQIYEDNFKSVQQNLKEIKKTNPTLATMQINEQKYMSDMLIKLKDSLENFENQKDSMEIIQISKLEEQLNTLKTLMKPYNYKNTEVIGNIMTNDYAIKPKKMLIVVVAFVSGLILSIFLIFFMEFIKGMRKEEKITPNN